MDSRSFHNAPRDTAPGNNFDFLRFAFASSVIFSHSYALLLGGNDAEPLFVFSHGTLSFGGLPVLGFFCISGYLITASWLRSRGLWGYLKKRVLRIYPGYLAAMAICFVVAAPLAGANLHSLFAPRHIGQFSLQSVFFESYSELTGVRKTSLLINGSVWTIKYEFLCYLLVPMLGFLGILSRRRWVLAGFVAMFIAFFISIWRNIAPHWKGYIPALVFGDPRTLLGFALYFVGGMAAYLYRDQIRYRPAIALAGVLAILAACFQPIWVYVITPLALPYLVFWLAFEPRLRMNDFARRGDFSYGIYLYAFPIQQILILWLRPWLIPWNLFVVSWALSVAAGIASWKLVEGRFLAKKRRHQPQEAAQVAPIALNESPAAR